MDANNTIQTKPFFILIFPVSKNNRCKEIVEGELMTNDAKTATTVVAKGHLHTKHARTMVDTIIAAEERYTFERILLIFIIKKYFVFQSIKAKKIYFTPLIIFSNPVMWSLNAFSPALVTA